MTRHTREAAQRDNGAWLTAGDQPGGDPDQTPGPGPDPDPAPVREVPRDAPVEIPQEDVREIDLPPLAPPMPVPPGPQAAH